jgi:hypothetical protein
MWGKLEMREIRTYELDGHDVPTCWFIDRAQTLAVAHGELWLTVEGEAGDIWLRAGESIELERRASVWMSAGREGARFSVTSVSAPAKHWAERAMAWFARRPASTRISVA